MELNVIQKASGDRFNVYLKHFEFQCKCKYVDCTHTLYNQLTIDSFYRVRVSYKKPILVTSAYRCQRHNSDVGGRHWSFHKLGSAMDLTIQDPKDIVEIDILLYYCRVFFDFVKLYELEDGTMFIHCHIKD